MFPLKSPLNAQPTKAKRHVTSCPTFGWNQCDETTFGAFSSESREKMNISGGNLRELGTHVSSGVRGGEE